MALALLFLAGIVLLAFPLLMSILGISIPISATVSMLLIGGALVGVVAILWTFKKLYVKTRADRAFVRTGRGFQVVKDGGAIVIPFLHEIVWVELRTFKIKVDRKNKEALLTKDKLRANVAAEFYIKVSHDEESIGAASRSLGNNMTQEGIVLVVEQKLISNLRTIAAQKTLEDLNSDRAAFMEQVTSLCAQDLKHNGLTLESASISSLDQTSTEHLDPTNVFDAQGLRTIAEITETNRTHTNKLTREGEQSRIQQDVETRKLVLALEQTREEAEAVQAAEIKRIKAEQARVARESEILALRSIELAEVEKNQQIEVAKRLQEQAIEVAAQVKDQAIEVATRSKESAVAIADKEKADNQALLAAAEKIRQERVEEITTVTVVQEAERKKRGFLISAEAEAEQQLISAQKQADAEAYRIERGAAAQKAAADAAAEATRKKAAAEKDAEIARAEAEKARAMVPVDVKSAEVDIDKRRIEEVVKPELQARDQHGQSAQSFELAKLFIQTQGHVEVERSKASVEIYRKVDVQAFATMEQLANVQGMAVRGHGLAGMFNSFVGNLDNVDIPEILNKVKGIVETLARQDNHAKSVDPSDPE